MPLNSSDVKLIQGSLNLTDSASRKKLFNVLVRHAEQYDLFLGTLLDLIEDGLTFVEPPTPLTISGAPYGPHAKVVMLYDPDVHQIKFNIGYLKDVHEEILVYALRHELTHAYDFLMLNAHDENMKNLIPKYGVMGDILYRQLRCIYETYRVNTTSLDHLAPFLLQQKNMKGQLIEVAWWMNLSDSEKQLNHGLIRYVGHFQKEGMFFTQILLDLKDSAVCEATYDVFELERLFNKTLPDRAHQYSASLVNKLERIFYEDFNSKLITLFRSLSPEQRQTLSALLIIRYRMLSNVAHDTLCFPKLEDCIKTPKPDCFILFLQCQALTNQASYSRSNLEIHAVFMERADFIGSAQGFLGQLCLPAKPETFPLEERTAPAIQENKFSLWRSALYTAFSTAGYSFVDTLAQTYIQHHQSTHASARLLLINTAYALFLGLCCYLKSDAAQASLALQVVTPVLLAILSKSLENVKHHRFIKHPLNAILFSIQITQGIEHTAISFAAGMVGSTLGQRLGESLSKCLGWNRQNQVEPTVEPPTGRKQKHR